MDFNQIDSQSSENKNDEFNPGAEGQSNYGNIPANNAAPVQQPNVKYIVIDKKNAKKCDNCGIFGHRSKNCPQPLLPTKWKCDKCHRVQEYNHKLQYCKIKKCGKVPNLYYYTVSLPKKGNRVMSMGKEIPKNEWKAQRIVDGRYCENASFTKAKSYYVSQFSGSKNNQKHSNNQTKNENKQMLKMNPKHNELLKNSQMHWCCKKCGQYNVNWDMTCKFCGNALMH